MEMESKKGKNDKSNRSNANGNDANDCEDATNFPIGMSLEEKCQRLCLANRFLRKKLDSKNVRIQTLLGEIQKRDRILHLSSTPTDDVEVLLNYTPDGHPLYEIKNKQQIPYFIKTERLSPIPQIDSDSETNFIEESAKNSEDDRQKLIKFAQLAFPQTTETNNNDSDIEISKESQVNVTSLPSTSKSAFKFCREPEENQWKIKDVEEISNDPESFELENLENLENSEISENIQSLENSENPENLENPQKSEHSQDYDDIEDGEIGSDSDSPDEEKPDVGDGAEPEKKLYNIFKQSEPTSLLDRDRELGRVSPISLSSLSSISSRASKSSQIKSSPAKLPLSPKISLKFDSPGPSKRCRPSSSDEDAEQQDEKRSRILRHPQIEKISQSQSKSKSKSKSQSQLKTTQLISIQIRVSEDSERRIITETETDRESESQNQSRRISVNSESGSEFESSASASSRASANLNLNLNPQLYIPDIESLDFRFWADTKNPNLPKFLIKFHENFYNGEEKEKDKIEPEKFTLIQQLEHRPPEIIKMGLRDIFKKLRRLEKLERSENVKSKNPARIWLDVRNPKIFSCPKSSVFNLSEISSSVTHFHLGSRLYSHIKRTAEEHEVKSSSFLEFLFRYLPHLEFLAINSDLLYGLNSVRELRGEPLTKLRALEFIQSKGQSKSNSNSKPETEIYGQFLRKIFKKAPNLHHLYGIPLQSLEKMEAAKIHSFSTLSYQRLELGVHDFQSQLNSLAKSRKFDHLEELDTRTSFIKNTQVKILCIQSMSRILGHNAYGLKTLHVEAEGPKKMFKIPTLRKVENLVFHMNPNLEEEGSTNFFPKEMGIRDFITKFPALTNVEIVIEIEIDRDIERNIDIDLEIGTGGEGSNSFKVQDGAFTSLTSARGLFLFEKNFPPWIFTKDTFLKVKGLTLRNFCPVECFPKIPSMFSNIRVLRLCHRASDVGRILIHVFQYWKRLEWLILEVDVDGNLDAGITGIDKDVCDNLRDNMQQLEDPQIKHRISRQRINLSISHLTELTFLRFVLRMGNNFDISRPLMTSLSALYGFGKDLMPKLTVQLGFHESVTVNEKELMISSLSSILPFVIFES